LVTSKGGDRASSSIPTKMIAVSFDIRPQSAKQSSYQKSLEVQDRKINIQIKTFFSTFRSHKFGTCTCLVMMLGTGNLQFFLVVCVLLRASERERERERERTKRRGRDREREKGRKQVSLGPTFIDTRLNFPCIK
jgi:hypothetical protein